MTSASTLHTIAVRAKLAAARKAFRCQRLASQLGRRGEYYTEHCLLDEARKCRIEMLDVLRAACRHWRSVLGIVT